MSSGKLWNKNFTIITVGTVVSMVGGLLADFAMALVVLDLTHSTFLYSLFMVAFTVPRIIVPIIAGPFVDKFSRRKMIYILDFIMGAFFLGATVFAFFNWINYALLIIGSIIISSISSIYRIAYESFYPLLIEEGNFSKAYSVSSTLESVVTVITPLSAVLYNWIGLAPLFLINGISYIVAAIMETLIHVEEKYVKPENESFGLSAYWKTFKEGISYLKDEKGLMTIVAYFTVCSFAGASLMVIGLPYFKENYNYGEYVYLGVMGAGILGRVLAGAFHYKMNIPCEKKFLVALCVYFATCICDGVYIFLPIALMIVINFINGCLGMTSYNIRISTTQAYIPDDKKGRFNGAFNMFDTVGLLIGELIAGVLGDVIDMRFVIAIFMGINFIAVFFTMLRRRGDVKKIYNRMV